MFLLLFSLFYLITFAYQQIKLYLLTYYSNEHKNLVVVVRAEMTRAYRVKGKKRKNVEKYHREEEDGEQVQPKKPNLQNKEEPSQTPTPIITEENNNNELVGIPIAPSTENNSEKPGVTFILERASLEVAKVGKVLLFFFYYMDLGHVWIQLIELIY
jgi:hypothetical protein